MGQKRKGGLTEFDGISQNKRFCSSLSGASELLDAADDHRSDFASVQPRIDPNSGQRGAFPGLDNGHDDLFYGPANDGLDYLRMVRSEARGVPNLLVAPKQDGVEEDRVIYESGVGDTRGYYQDGAYTAAPYLEPAHSADTSSTNQDKDPQVAYYEALVARFRKFRAELRLAPPSGAITALDEKHPISLPGDSAKATAQWRRLIHSTNPLPAQLVAMDQQTVLRLIKLIVNSMKRGRSIEKRMSRWIWALLGKLNDVGCLASEEVGVIRDFGKRAVWLLVGIREKKEANDTESISTYDGIGNENNLPMYADTGDEIERMGETGSNSSNSTASLCVDAEAESTLDPALDTGNKQNNSIKISDDEIVQQMEDEDIKEEDQLAALKERMMASVANIPLEEGNHTEYTSRSHLERDNTIVTIDMIITIVGELYGQRDLLEHRDLWDEEP